MPIQDLRASAVGNRAAQRAALEYFVSHRDMRRFGLDDFEHFCAPPPFGEGEGEGEGVDAAWWSVEQEMHMLREVVRAFARLRIAQPQRADVATS